MIARCRKSFGSWPLLLLCLLVPVSAQPQTIAGAGATFPAPVYLKWAEAAKSALGIDVSYDAVGSGQGIDRIMRRTIDFGASDTPVPPEKLAAAKLLQFPTVIGAVVVIVNLPRLRDGQLRLTGDALADIYAGRIKKWNDPRLVELNPAVTMPNIPIAPVHRFENSGTTAVFTSYLSIVSPEWRAGPGTGTGVMWPTGAAARGSDGVASAVLNTRGGIGYVENSFATQNHLATARLRNRAGLFVKPTTASFIAVAETGHWTAPDFAPNLVDTDGAANWPIVTCTFVMIPRDPADDARSGAVRRFFDWAYRDGGGLAQQLDYIPLPAAVQDGIRATWREVFSE
jgi:phosphate transport system substrate-binding protein